MLLYRMHLKTEVNKDEGATREDLVSFCLGGGDKRLAIGWSYLHHEIENTLSLDEMVKAEAAKDNGHPKILSIFANLNVDDLVWTRDTYGNYYICRVIKKPKSYFDFRLDIGAVVEVDCKKVGTSVPGNVISRFCRSGPNPTIERIADEKMIEYTKDLYNQLSGNEFFEVQPMEQELCDLLPALDLEELVIDYLQIKYDYYLSKNSVARLDTTIKVECELFPRSGDGNSAVVQVKNRGEQPRLEEYQQYVKDGKKVFLFFAKEVYNGKCDGIECILKAEIEQFAKEYLRLLPPSITKWIEIWMSKRNNECHQS